MSTRDTDDGFLSRWSRRKAQAQAPGSGAASEPLPVTPSAHGRPVAGTLPQGQPEGPFPGQTLAAAGAPDPAEPKQPPGPQEPPDSRPRPTLADVQGLDAASDYRAFVAPDVDPAVRNAAFKKLFHSDPHFNVMDGLDVYIDDYHTPQPLSRAIMRTLVQARALGLIDDELKEQELPAKDAPPGRPTSLQDVPDHPAPPSGHEGLADAPPGEAADAVAAPVEPLSSPAEASTAPQNVVPLRPRPDNADPA